jgi:sugar phosphate isomerase/epimerase
MISVGKIPIGIQSFTVREELKADFKGTMTALAGMGYQGIELGGDTGGMTPEELAAFAKSLGLLVPGFHASTADLLNPAAAVYGYAVATGARFVTTSRDRDVPKWDSVIEEVKTAAQVAKSKGLQFTYHNHAGEFAKIAGKYALDILFEKTDPALVQCELDTYWIKKGGEDPVAYIRKYKGRCPQIHLKDMDASDGSFTEVGNGIMDLPAIFALAGEVGAEWMIVEQDRWKGRGIDSARISIENLKKAGLA